MQFVVRMLVMRVIVGFSESDACVVHGIGG